MTIDPTNPLPHKIENDNRELWLTMEEIWSSLKTCPSVWNQYLNR